MLSASDLSVSFGAQTVLDNVRITIDKRTRAGLIGANGSGKTTLLRVLAGIEEAESGTVTQARGSVVDYLPQRSTFQNERTVYEHADGGYTREHRLVAEREKTAAILTETPDDAAALHRVAEIDQQLESTGFYTRSARIARVLSGLGFSDEDFNRPLEEFSGGWRMRAALARSLLTRPDILLLDEPTNYLDSEARMWLSSFLRDFDGGVLVVSHDRAFLDETVTSIIELFRGRAKRYTGSFSEYERTRREEVEQLVAAWETQQKEIRKQEEFIRRFRATASKAKQVQSRVKALEKTDTIELPEHLRPISISIPPAVPSGRVVLDVVDLHKSYGSLHVIDDLRFTLKRGHRLVVVGLNGAGKSTLLRLLSGTESPDSGEVRRGTGVSVAYFAQDSAETLPTGMTVEQYVTAAASDATRPRVRDILGSFLFSGDSVDKPLEVLSGGERSRVAMATLLVRPANLLILDEPTNHLDMTSQEVLARALMQYDGTVVAVSHDRHFLREIGTEVLALWPVRRHEESVPSHHWRLYPGAYRDFESVELGRVFFTDEAAAGASNRRSAPDEAPTDTAIDYEERKERRNRVQRLRRRAEEIIESIDSADREIQSLHEELSIPENYQDAERARDLQQSINVAEERRDELHTEWEELEEAIGRLEADA